MDDETRPSRLAELVELASEAAVAGGRRTLAWFGGLVPAQSKSDASPVTEADRDAETTIRALLRRYTPNFAILGEEDGEEGVSDWRWVIDPIDGTRTFMRGVPFYGTMVGLEHRGKAVAGAVYLPALDELTYAADGLGCWWNGRRARVSTVTDLSQALLLCSDVAINRSAGGAWDRLAAAVALNRTWGDVYGYIMVATGRADIMADAQLKPWDCCAALPLIREAGGAFTSWTGVENHTSGSAVATNPHLHAQVVKILSGLP
jgi:histidinol phosphatase-like enzyme (inositol monophosphatase family)